MCPQSYFLQEQSFSLSVSFSLALPLYVFRSFSFTETLGESAANRAVTVNSLFVLLHGERREGSRYLIDWEIYTSFGCETKEEWICGGQLVSGDLTKWKERDSLHFLTHTYTHSCTSFSTLTHIDEHYLLYVLPPGNTST